MFEEIFGIKPGIENCKIIVSANENKLCSCGSTYIP